MADNVGTCRHCRATFNHHSPLKPGQAPPRCCGGIHCRALEHWTDEEWEGRAWLAVTRASAGVPADVTDVEALRRCPNPASTFGAR